MGSMNCPCTTSYRSSIETTALECLVFEKIAFLYFGVRQTNRWTGPLHKAALAVASGGLITADTIAANNSLAHCLDSNNLQVQMRLSTNWLYSTAKRPYSYPIIQHTQIETTFYAFRERVSNHIFWCPCLRWYVQYTSGEKPCSSIIPGGTERRPPANIQCQATIGRTQSADKDHATTMSTAA